MMRNIYRNSMSITSSPPEKEGTKDVEDFSSLGIWTTPYCNFWNESHSTKPEYWELVEEENGRLGCRVKKVDIRQCLKTTYFNPWRTMSAGGSPFLLPTLTTPSIWKVKQIEITESRKVP